MMFYYYKLLLNEYYVNKMNFLQKLQWGLQIKYVFFESQLALFTKQSHNKGFQLLRTQRQTKVITVVQDCVPQIFRVFFVFSQQFFFFLICRHSLHILGIQLTLEQLWGVKNPCTTQTICIPGSTSALTICIPGSTSMDSTNLLVCSTLVFTTKKNLQKQTHAVQTHIIQRSTEQPLSIISPSLYAQPMHCLFILFMVSFVVE